ncbi:MAG: hypothetical protein H6713_27615 [Myxococcales bacterium]|nr:hypothetical protein [Myxococcales bacterium]
MDRSARAMASVYGGLIAGLLLASPLAQAAPDESGAPPDSATEEDATDASPRGLPDVEDVTAPIEVPQATSGISEDPDERARELYRAGEEAYNLGDFSRAINSFEGAYSLSSRPDLLYNVSLSYFRRYDASRELTDLKRARAVLVNFEIALRRDPTIGDPDQVRELMKRIEDRLSVDDRPRDASGERALRSAGPEGPRTAGACTDLTDQPDPGRASRVGGAVAMGTGALILAGGVASIAAFTLKGQEFENTLAGLQSEFMAESCEGRSSERCQLLQESIDTTINNGRQANILAATLGAGLTVLGTAGVVTGAIFYAQGNRRTKSWEHDRELRIAPSLGGVVLRGRF